MTADVWLDVLARIQDAPVHLIAETAEAALLGTGAEHALLRTVDHTERQLLATVHEDVAPVSVDDSDAGRVYASQRPSRQGDTVLVPLTERGNRRGVLEVTGGPFDVEQLRRLAAVIAVSIEFADRVTDRYLTAGRRQRLTLAAEMQWALLPGKAYSDPHLDVAGFLEPAYMVVGDGFDWCRLPDSLQVTVCEGTGRGVGAALAASLALGAVRNARRAGLDLIDQAHLTDQALYSHYGGSQHVAALLVDLRLSDGRLTIVDAGSPQLLRMRSSGAVELIELDAQLPLGMFEDTPYAAQHAQLEPGDRLVLLSEGVGATVSPQGATFGGDLLLAAVRRTRLLPAAEAVRYVIRVMGEHRIDPDPLDDAVVLCLDWRPGPAQ